MAASGARRSGFRRWLVAALALAALVWRGGPFQSCFSAALAVAGLALRSCRRPQRSALAAEGSDVATSPSPEAWREFRAQLISGGLKLTTDEEEEEGQQQQEEAVEVPAGPASARVPVAKQNEELLRSQNEALWNEYINGAWAHPSLVEPGGLLVRRPLCAQIVRQMRKGESSFWGDLLRKRLDRELPEPAEGRSREELFQSWSQNTNYCYRLAEKVVDEAMDSLKERLSRAGPDSLRQEDMVLVSSLQGEQNQWQAVCLVLSVPAGFMNKAAEAVTINRPIARGMDEVLAQLLLNGENPSVPQHDEETVKRCAKAFGSEAGIYVGGPEQQRQPGLLVHGFEDLPGSTELAPGTRIYKGGARAAIDGVLAGKFSPLDFRWFLGRHRGLSTAGGEWFGVACARPIALKQCLGLPKPLWHEVMELCGGESATFSRLELTKRQDLDEEVREENSEDL